MPSRSKLINTIIFETKWFIWKSRNVTKHELRRMNKDVIVSSIKNAVYDQLISENDGSLSEIQNIAFF